MRLTEEQSKIVEENYKLIGWYIKIRQKETGIRLDYDDWHGLLAIELCNTVMKFDPKFGTSLSSYYKVRCDNLVLKQYQMSQRQKRSHISVPYIDELVSSKPYYDDETVWNEFIESINPEYREIMTMVYHGYTQKEIAKKMNLSQSYISKIVRKIRSDYHEKHD